MPTVAAAEEECPELVGAAAGMAGAKDIVDASSEQPDTPHNPNPIDVSMVGPHAHSSWR